MNETLYLLKQMNELRLQIAVIEFSSVWVAKFLSNFHASNMNVQKLVMYVVFSPSQNENSNILHQTCYIFI